MKPEKSPPGDSSPELYSHPTQTQPQLWKKFVPAFPARGTLIFIPEKSISREKKKKFKIPKSQFVTSGDSQDSPEILPLCSRTDLIAGLGFISILFVPFERKREKLPLE